MPRPQMVTRSLTVTVARCLCADISNGKTFEETVTIARTHDQEKLEKLIQQRLPASSRFLRVLQQTTEKHLYGIREQAFIEMAEVLPDRQAHN